MAWVRGMKIGIFLLLPNPSWFDHLLSEAWMEGLAQLCSCSKFERYLNSTDVSRSCLKLNKMSKMARNLPGFLGKWGEWVVHPTSQKSQPVFPLLAPIYLSTKSQKSRLPISSSAPRCCVEVQAVTLSCLDTCSGLLTGLPGSISPSLILYMVARGLFKIPTDCVPPRLKPFWGFPLPLRLLNMPGLVCPRLLLWPHLPPHLCTLISTSTSERLCLGSFVTWGPSPSECCQPCLSHHPVAWRTVFIFMLGWSTYSQGRLLWSSQTWSGPPLTCHGL